MIYYQISQKFGAFMKEYYDQVQKYLEELSSDAHLTDLYGDSANFHAVKTKIEVISAIIKEIGDKNPPIEVSMHVQFGKPSDDNLKKSSSRVKRFFSKDKIPKKSEPEKRAGLDLLNCFKSMEKFKPLQEAGVDVSITALEATLDSITASLQQINASLQIEHETPSSSTPPANKAQHSSSSPKLQKAASKDDRRNTITERPSFLLDLQAPKEERRRSLKAGLASTIDELPTHRKKPHSPDVPPLKRAASSRNLLASTSLPNIKPAKSKLSRNSLTISAENESAPERSKHK